MKWAESFFAVILLGMTVFTMIGCGKAEEPANQQSATTSEAPAPTMQGNRPSAPAIDWVAAAAKLGVTEQQLRDALANPGQGPPDFAAAAEKLGVSEQELREVLNFPQGAPPSSGSPPPNLTPEGKSM